MVRERQYVLHFTNMAPFGLLVYHSVLTIVCFFLGVCSSASDRERES